jgi:adenine-specific DNA-methyltransferase
LSKIDDAIDLLRKLGLPKKQQNERSGLTLLALAKLGPDDDWSTAMQPLLRTVDIMEFMREVYGKDYKPNSRETIRRQTLHLFEQARVANRNPDDPSRPTNSGKNCYGLSDEVLPIVKAFGTDGLDELLSEFIANIGSLNQAYKKHRESEQVPLKLPDGVEVFLSAGEHNELQAAIIEEMGPRFAQGANVLYVGDTAQKVVVCDTEALDGLSITIAHDKLPDVVLFDPEKNWLFLVEAVTSHGPVSPKRYAELEEMLADCPADRIYITAFLTRDEFRKYAADIAWETEVWIAENPGHMIHFNGPKFMGPYKPI